MLCDECQAKPATVHITKVVDNQKTEWHLCEECARKSGETGMAFHMQKMLENHLSVHDFVKALFEQTQVSEATTEQGKACPVCGMNHVEFSRTGKLGCDQCYLTFGDDLEPLVKKIHGACVHTGKIPRRAGAAMGMWQRVRILRQELERLIAREAYEQAAVVRDEIRELENNLQVSTADSEGKDAITLQTEAKDGGVSP
ncbi:MAG TPA: UvrB/UvrC motif-containing protein [Patescibacteria group bacterium]|nr:UvrB/UvrC motif-containing protein [Patescibacteria group bacterium]